MEDQMSKAEMALVALAFVTGLLLGAICTLLVVALA